MKLSRSTSDPRLIGTTLLLAGLSLATSPELLAGDPLAQFSQSPIEASAHPVEGSFAELVTESWEDKDEEDEIVPIPRKKRAEDFRGPRFGYCVGLDTSCLLGGIKTGYSWKNVGLLVQLPFFDVEGSLYLWTFERSDGLLMRPFVSVDWNALAYFMVNFGTGVEFVGSSRWIVRPQIAVSPRWLNSPFPLGSLSFLFVY